MQTSLCLYCNWINWSRAFLITYSVFINLSYRPPKLCTSCLINLSLLCLLRPILSYSVIYQYHICPLHMVPIIANISLLQAATLRWHTTQYYITSQRCDPLQSWQHFTCSTVLLQCYRRQAIPMEQAKIRASVTLYTLDRSLPNMKWLIMMRTLLALWWWHSTLQI